MPNSSFQVPFLAHNSTVKAWCVTSNHTIATALQSDFDEKNFVDGYNLRLDVATELVTSVSPQWVGALKFSFITPLTTTKYKVLVQPYGLIGTTPMLAHALNSSLYPKTQDSFWIRVGYFNSPATRSPNTVRTDNQVTNIALWQNATASLGVVVV